MLSSDILNINGKILVLVCCAPCCCGVVEFLAKSKINATLFFYNPNIFPKQEYEHRKSEVLRIANLYNIPFIDTDYIPEEYLKATNGLETCPERGKRCDSCFSLRLTKTAIFARDNGFDYFTSTLAVSRWKSLEQVNRIGKSVSNMIHIPYLDINWRKQGLQERTREIIKENNIYEQDYCGCPYSIRSKKE
ncbi:MAG: epoxyqueuosine reductase QueH [Alphaproteobacteria bacterium]|nr:epoxyqueuosine reductase QueH [Alphaproteobacteria bacterium]